MRGWIRRVNGRAEWLRAEATTAAYAFDPMLQPHPASREPLADAISALGVAAAATRRMLGPTATPWEFLTAVARGQLLTRRRSD